MICFFVSKQYYKRILNYNSHKFHLLGDRKVVRSLPLDTGDSMLSPNTAGHGQRV